MTVYIDTNVIVAKYHPRDPYYASSRSFLDSSTDKVASPLSIVELMAVTSRQAKELYAPDEILREPPRRRIRAVVEFLLRDSNITIVPVAAQARVKVAKSILTLPLEYVSSLRLASSLGLRTLDLMHLAYAYNIRGSGYELDSFVTTDTTILKKSVEIEKLLKIHVKKPTVDT